MKNGLVYVAFGKVYDALAAHTIYYSRRFTDMPICVFTNLKERDKKWEEVRDIEFRYLPMGFERNREVRTKMIQFSPFDLTLGIDCDSVVQRDGAEKIFDMIDDNDLLLSVDMNWRQGDRVLSVYKRMMELVGVRLPIIIYHGGFQLFRKNERVSQFFNLWNEYWKLSGEGRDMPALNCAVKNSGVLVKDITVRDDMYSGERRCPAAIIQHRYSGDFIEKFNLPKWRPWKAFDTNVNDFTWVDF